MHILSHVMQGCCAAQEATVPYTEKSVGLFLGDSLRRPVLVRPSVSHTIGAGSAISCIHEAAWQEP
jgi:hypothetical protein